MFYISPLTFFMVPFARWQNTGDNRSGPRKPLEEVCFCAEELSLWTKTSKKLLIPFCRPCLCLSTGERLELRVFRYLVWLSNHTVCVNKLSKKCSLQNLMFSILWFVANHTAFYFIIACRVIIEDYLSRNGVSKLISGSHMNAPNTRNRSWNQFLSFLISKCWKSFVGLKKTYITILLMTPVC